MTMRVNTARRGRLALTIALLASAAVAGIVNAAPAAEGGQKFSVTLRGANECTNAGVCGAGEPNASGTADLTINPGQRRICWEITTTGIHTQYTITGAHIHPGAAGTNGGVLVHLSAAKNGTATGCVDTTRAVINDILAAPQNFYINIHYVDQDPADPALPSFAPGGIRGQIVKGRLK